MEDRISQIFSAFLERNVMVTVVILAVLLVRFLIRRCPKKYSYLLWGIVGIRMLFDLPFASSLSLFNLFQVKMNSVPLAEQVTQIPSGETISVHETVNTNTNPVMTGGDVPSVFSVSGRETENTILTVFAVIWLVGIVLLLVYGILSYVKCRRLVKTAVRLEPVEVQTGGPHGHRRLRRGTNVWECDGIWSPFVLGIFQPRIYIPFHMEPQERTYILAHEQTHIRRCDHLIKLVAYLLLCVYWWNPLVWLAFYYMVRDMEMSCDEAVLEIFGDRIKKEYSSSLLSFAMERHGYTFAPLAFGEGDVGKRIKNVLNFKKPHTWVAILVVVFIVFFAVSCLTNQKSDKEDVSKESGQEKAIIQAYEMAVNQKDVESYIPLFADAIQSEMREYINENGEASFFKEDQIKILSMRKGDDVSASKEKEQYGEVSVFDVDMEITFSGEEMTRQEVQFVFVKEQQTWKLYRVSGGLLRGGADFEYKLPDNLVEEKMEDMIVFTPNVYKVGEASMCANYMISAGYIQKFYTADDWGIIKEGKIEQVYSDNHNHVEDYGQVDGLCAPGYLVKVDFDLYSPASLEMEKNNGTDISQIDQTGQYWLLYLARENEETGYIMALNTRNYTREDMLAWAKSFQY